MAGDFADFVFPPDADPQPCGTLSSKMLRHGFQSMMPAGSHRRAATGFRPNGKSASSTTIKIFSNGNWVKLHQPTDRLRPLNS